MLFTTALIATVVGAQYTPTDNTQTWISYSAQQKSDDLWAQITADQSVGTWKNGIFDESMDPTFDSLGDEFSYGDDGTLRQKEIHCVGAVAKITFTTLFTNEFTGIFKEYTTNQGYIRLSVASPPDPEVLNLRPGMGLKILRDGMDSANLVAMYSVAGQASWNFFENDFSNFIPPAPPSLEVLQAKFAEGTKYIQSVGLSEFSQYDSSGNTVADPVFPFSIRFTPTSEVNTLFASDTYSDYMEDLKTIPAGTNLYNVYVKNAPDELGGYWLFIGYITTMSEFVSSNWGDEHMYFRHQKSDDDMAINTEWTPYYPFYEAPLSAPVINHANCVNEVQDNLVPRCPFAGLWDLVQ